LTKEWAKDVKLVFDRVFLWEILFFKFE